MIDLPIFHPGQTTLTSNDFGSRKYMFKIYTQQLVEIYEPYSLRMTHKRKRRSSLSIFFTVKKKISLPAGSSFPYADYSEYIKHIYNINNKYNHTNYFIIISQCNYSNSASARTNCVYAYK
jgi:hypothetical protein